MFHLLGPEEIDYIAQRCLKATYEKDEVIVEEGTHPMNKVFLVL